MVPTSLLCKDPPVSRHFCRLRLSGRPSRNSLVGFGVRVVLALWPVRAGMQLPFFCSLSLPTTGLSSLLDSEEFTAEALGACRLHAWRLQYQPHFPARPSHVLSPSRFRLGKLCFLGVCPCPARVQTCHRNPEQSSLCSPSRDPWEVPGAAADRRAGPSRFLPVGLAGGV